MKICISARWHFFGGWGLQLFPKFTRKSLRGRGGYAYHSERHVWCYILMQTEINAVSVHLTMFVQHRWGNKVKSSYAKWHYISLKHFILFVSPHLQKARLAFPRAQHLKCWHESTSLDWLLTTCLWFQPLSKCTPACVRERNMLSVRHVGSATVPPTARLRTAVMTVMTSLHTLP